MFNKFGLMCRHEFTAEVTHPTNNEKYGGVYTFEVSQSNHNKKYSASTHNMGCTADIYDTPEQAIDYLIQAQACTRVSEIKEVKEEMKKTLVRTTWDKVGGGYEHDLHEYGMHIVDDVRVWTFANSGDAYDCTQGDDDLKTGDVLLIPSEKVVGISDCYPFAITKEKGQLHGVEKGYKIEDIFVCNIDEDYKHKALKVARSLAKSYDI
tara:strand:+ start:218 stop:841 length:624 start_codon:yes stop_codon:yes gene_type:complete